MRRWLAVISSGIVLALVTASAAPRADAASPPLLYEVFPSLPTHDPQYTPIPPDNPCGVAVDSSGRFYVSDYYNNRISIFHSDRSVVTTIRNVDPGNGPCGLAVDSSGVIYVNTYHQGVLRFDPSELPKESYEHPNYLDWAYIEADKFVPELLPGVDDATGVAVDPTSDHIYVTTRTYVAEYDATGAPVLDGGDPIRIGLGTLGDAYGIAVSDHPATDGYLYVPDATDDTVKVYDPGVDLVNPVATIDGDDTPQDGFVSLEDSAVAVDDSNGHLYVVDKLDNPLYEHPRAILNEFDVAGSFLGQIPEGSNLIHGGPTGLAIDNSGGPTQSRLYVTNGNSDEGNVRVYGPPVPGFKVDVFKSGSGAGTVKRIFGGGIDCGSTCSGEFQAGTVVTLTATPFAGSVFDGWSVIGSAPCPGTGPCEVTVSNDVEVIAEFVSFFPMSVVMTSSGAGGGAVTSTPDGIDCGGSCEGLFEQGSTVTLSATPDPGSTFEGWSGGGCSGRGPCVVTMDAARSVSATFSTAARESFPAETFGKGPAVAAKPPRPSSAAIRLSGIHIGRGTALLRLSLPEAGTVVSSGDGFAAVRLSRSAAGPATLRLSLTQRSRRMLASASRPRLAFDLMLRFKPADGGAGSVIRKRVGFPVEDRRGRGSKVR